MSEREGAQREPGSVGEEAARLAEAIRGWAATTFPGLTSGLTEHLATGAPECRYCPFCQLVAVLRGDRPEVTERVAEAAAAVADAVRAVADAVVRPAGAAWSAAADRDAEGEPAPAGPAAHAAGAGGSAGRRVEPIDLV